MKLIHNIKYFGVAAISLMGLLTSCTDEILTPGDGPQSNGDEEGKYIYFSLDLAQTSPASTRAVGDYAETENSMIQEAALDNVIIILAELKKTEDIESGKYYYDKYREEEPFRVIAYAEAYKDNINEIIPVEGSYNQYRIIAKAEQSAFADDFGGNQADTPNPLYLIVLANTKNNMQVDRPAVHRGIQRDVTVSNGDLEKLVPFGNVKESDQYFLMSSREAYPIKLSLTQLKNKHYSPDKALKLTESPITKNENQGPVEIERVAARIDLDWTHMKFAIDTDGYSHLLEREGFDKIKYKDYTRDNLKYTIEIDAVALANMSKDYMLYPETVYFDGDPTSDDDGTWFFMGNLGDDVNGKFFNHIRDPKGFSKTSDNNTGSFYQSLNQIKVNNGKSAWNHSRYSFRTLESFATKDTHLGGINDEDDWNSYWDGNDKYVAWHYTLPNSIHIDSKQLKNNTTAVIYRAKIEDKEKIPAAKANGDDVFAYNNTIYGNFNTFVNDALNADNSDNFQKMLFDLVWTDYIADTEWDKMEDEYKGKISSLTAQNTTLQNEIDALNRELEDPKLPEKEQEKRINSIQEKQSQIWANNAEKDKINNLLANLNDFLDEINAGTFIRYSFYDPEKFKAAALKNNIRTYTATNVGTDEHPDYVYYCYYYYWIRHNDNDNDMKMGPMEFAIVRNYVYKLSVSKIYDLGYPEIPGDDPDPEDPGDEVEDTTVKLKVETKVLPWGVRYDDNITLY